MRACFDLVGGQSIKMFVDDKQVGQARIDKTVPFIFSGDDFMDIGEDSGAPVTEDFLWHS